MFKIKNTIIILTLGLVLFGCGSDRAGDEKVQGVLGVVDEDRDNDGLSDNDELTIYFTNPDSNDTDNDGLLDGEEVKIYDTNVTNSDTDNDGLKDGDEINIYDTNATNADTDRDGLLDGEEINIYDTNATNVDTDGDSLDDASEINIYDTNATNEDTDGDGLLDADEINIYDTNASNVDTDGDGLTDPMELNIYDTNATNPDTDGDGLFDGNEIKIYDTNASNNDTDNDGLKDGDEINIYDTNATNADTDGDGLLDGEEINVYDTNATNIDTDNDGLSDGDEVNIYDTNATNIDTDNDGLTDGDEINTYDSNATNPDADGDGLKDGDEVNVYGTSPINMDTDNDGLNDDVEIYTYETNATNPDTDGDCLLDGFEVLNYESNPKSSDTDGDNVPDGIEVYASYAGDFNISCLHTPETLEGGYNRNPAIDGIPTPENDILDVLDPSNDSDGDGQSNLQENNCTEGDVLDANKFCPSLIDTALGEALISHGYSYVPGGFDVDGDGINEGGFWMSRYQARSSGIEIPSEVIIESVGNANRYLSRNFNVLNKNVQVLSYDESILKETGVVAGNELLFEEMSVADRDRISRMTPYLALVCLSEYHLKDENGDNLDVNITMPTMKQYIHVKKLLEADLEHNGDGRHIRNGLLGTDPNVPLFTYSIIIDEFGKDRKEYVRNLVQLRDTYGNKTFDFDKDVEDWWDVDIAKFKYTMDGANSTQDLGNGIGIDKDPYAVIVRGGTILDITQGPSGASTDDVGTTNGIGFRAATDYIY